MIELNLLKERLARFKRKRVIINLFIIYFGGIAFILIALLMNFMGNKMQVKRIMHDIKKIEEKMENEKDIIESIEKKGKDTEELLKSIAFFMSESEKRVLWTGRLNFIGSSVPYGIWLNRLASDSPDEDSKERTITIEGHLLPFMTNERESIDRFVRTLGSGSIFETVSLQEISRVVKGEKEIVSFTIVCGIDKKGKKDAEIPD
ncbi:MAG TPA: PilN domain-containing protein [bacterium]|nr:PilN domain-containing protein [bacterium]